MNSPCGNKHPSAMIVPERNVEKTYSSVCLECEIFRKLGRIFMEVTTKTLRHESEQRNASLLTSCLGAFVVDALKPQPSYDRPCTSLKWAARDPMSAELSQLRRDRRRSCGETLVGSS